MNERSVNMAFQSLQQLYRIPTRWSVLYHRIILIAEQVDSEESRCERATTTLPKSCPSKPKSILLPEDVCSVQEYAPFSLSEIEVEPLYEEHHFFFRTD